MQKLKRNSTKSKFIECRWIDCSCQRRRQQVAAPKLISLAFFFFYVFHVIFTKIQNFYCFSLYQSLIHQLKEVYQQAIQLLMHQWAVMLK